MIVVGALAAHGIFDAVHGGVIQNSGVPVWWPDFCRVHLGAAGALAWLLKRADLTMRGSGRPNRSGS